jgi:hypothetical protein
MVGHQTGKSPVGLKALIPCSVVVNYGNFHGYFEGFPWILLLVLL